VRAIIVGAVVAIAAGAYWLGTANEKPDMSRETPPADGAIVEIVLAKELSANAQIGKTMFEAKCAVCHGINAVGKLKVAPPLVHIIYEPSHHGDEAFQGAVALGVRAHHWPFGNMPPVEGLSRGDVKMIVTYIRELQRANGIN